VRFGFNRNLYYSYQTTGLPVTLVAPSFSTINDNYSKKQASTSFDGRDDITWSHGAHTIKGGIEVRRVDVNEGNSADSTMTFASYTTADPYYDLAKNTYSSYVYSAALPTKGLRKTDYYDYIQDEWKLRSNLTLNSGLGYSFYGPFSEVNNKAYPYDIFSCTGNDAYGPNNPGLCKQGAQFAFPNYRDFEPRVSLTWAPDVLKNRTVSSRWLRHV